jgi:hypothetical protein
VAAVGHTAGVGIGGAQTVAGEASPGGGMSLALAYAGAVFVALGILGAFALGVLLVLTACNWLGDRVWSVMKWRERRRAQ